MGSSGSRVGWRVFATRFSTAWSHRISVAIKTPDSQSANLFRFQGDSAAQPSASPSEEDKLVVALRLDGEGDKRHSHKDDLLKIDGAKNLSSPLRPSWVMEQPLEDQEIQAFESKPLKTNATGGCSEYRADNEQIGQYPRRTSETLIVNRQVIIVRPCLPLQRRCQSAHPQLRLGVTGIKTKKEQG